MQNAFRIGYAFRFGGQNVSDFVGYSESVPFGDGKRVVRKHLHAFDRSKLGNEGGEFHQRGIFIRPARHEHMAASVPAPGHEACTVTVTLDGATRTYTVEKGKESLLEGGLRNGIELPYSCKGGVCSTCRCRLVAGEVDMDANFALEDYEVARGFVLACQSYPVTDAVTVSFDDTGTG